MSRSLNQRSYGAGEISPELWGRSDLAKYTTALKTCLNFYVNKRGLLLNTPGTEFIKESRYSAGRSRLVTFKFGFQQQYIIEFGNQYIRFYRNGNQIAEGSKAITAITNASPGVVTVTGHGYSNGDELQISGIVGPIGNYLNNRNLVVAGVTTDTFTLKYLDGTDVNTTSFGAYTSGGFVARVYQIATPYLEVDLPLLKFTQSFDVMQIRHGDYAPMQLERHSETDWVLMQKNYWPFLKPETTNLSATVGASGVFNYQYQVTTYDTVTGEESLPGGVGGITSTSLVETAASSSTTTTTITSVGHGLTNGSTVVFTKNLIPKGYRISSAVSSGTTVTITLSSSPTTAFQVGEQIFFTVNYKAFATTILIASKSYTLTGVSGATLTVTGEANFTGTLTFSGSDPLHMAVPVGGPVILAGKTYTVGGAATDTFTLPSEYSITCDIGAGAHGSFAGSSFSATSASAAQDIASITNTNPIVIGTTSAHGLEDGDQVVIRGTNVFGLDDVTFNVVKVDSTHVSLMGVDGTLYGTWGGGPGASICSTIFKLTNAAIPTNALPNVLTWGLDPRFAPLGRPGVNRRRFNVYSSIGGVLGFIGVSDSLTFSDTGIPPDPTKTPPQYNPILFGTNNHPSVANYCQQRLIEMATNNNPQGFFASRVGQYDNYTIHNPIQADDAIVADIATNGLTRIFDVVDCGFIVLFCDAGPLTVKGSQAGIITPDEMSVTKQMFGGSAQTPSPIQIVKNMIYFTADGKTIRDLQLATTPYYSYIQQSDEVSIFSSHLFDKNVITEWAFQLYPESIIWMIRDDGTMIGLTYVHEQGMAAFHRHDTLGLYESVAVAQEGDTSMVYVIVNRDGKRYIERFYKRNFTDITRDAVFTHSTGTYDGHLVTDLPINLTIQTLGQTITFGHTANLVANTAVFSSTNVGQTWHLKDVDGNVLITKITSVADSTHASSQIVETPSGGSWNGYVSSDVSIAAQTVYGLWWLEGQQVSILADGFVKGNPNDSQFSTIYTVTNGAITLDRPYSVVHIGLPYLSDLRTLDVDSPQEETQTDKKIIIQRVGLRLDRTRELYIGGDFPPEGSKNYDNIMDKFKLREYEGYTQPDDLFTGITPSIPVPGKYGFGGSFCLRNVSPLPVTVQNIVPLVQFQGGR